MKIFIGIKIKNFLIIFASIGSGNNSLSPEPIPDIVLNPLPQEDTRAYRFRSY